MLWHWHYSLLASQYIAESLKRSNSRSPSGCTARPRPRDQGLRPMSIHSTVPARPPATARPLAPVQAQRARPPAAGWYGTISQLSAELLSSQQGALEWRCRAGRALPRRCTTPARCRSPCSPDRGRPRCSRPRPLCRRRAPPRQARSHSAAVVLIQRRLEEARIPSLLYYFHSAVCASEVW